MELSVFGGTGYVGSAICKWVEEPVAVRLIDRESRKPVSGDVLYLLSTCHNYWMFDDIHRDVDTNLTILIDVLEEWRKNSPWGVFNYVSTWFVYGETDLPAKESTRCNPKGWYEVTKWAAERMVETYCRVHGLPYRILRVSSLYGGVDKGASPKKNALTWLVQQIKDDKPIGLYYGGRFLRDFLHVDEAARMILEAVQHAPRDIILNIGSGTPVEFGSVVRRAAGHFGYSYRIHDMEPSDLHKVIGVRDFWMDVSLAASLGIASRSFGIRQWNFE